jgi:NAD(P)-dependent dehydrogenase (short-subunit alcohol dehydrogenase family)
MLDGEKTLVIEGDVSEEAHAKAAFERTILELGSLDVLMNNAGIEINGTVVDSPTAEWD